MRLHLKEKKQQKNSVSQTFGRVFPYTMPHRVKGHSPLHISTGIVQGDNCMHASSDRIEKKKLSKMYFVYTYLSKVSTTL